MQKSSSSTNHNSSATHRRVQHSSTLNRKYVRRPSNTRSRSRSAATASAAEAEARAIRAVQKAQIQKRRQAIAEEMNKSYPTAAKRGQVSARKAQSSTQSSAQSSQRQSAKKSTKQPSSADIPAQPHPLQTRARAATRSAQAAKSPQLTAQQRKDAAISSALRSVATMEQQNTITSQNLSKPKSTKKKVKSRRAHTEKSGNGKRFLIAFSCAATCVVALALIIGANSPDVSVRVAAVQTGIDAAYPSYVPRDYSLTDVISEEGKVTMQFSGPDTTFTLVEERSSWDTASLLNNYVKPTWKENYTATHEQGITIYMSGSNAAWVNGNIFYTITDDNGVLTKKQIRNIITSL